MSIDKIALWERLRNDPDFDPEWWLTLGHQPPAEPGEHRVWADAPPEGHVIDEMSWSEGWTSCATCGAIIQADSRAEHVNLWGLHTGNRTTYREPKPEQMADDDEVHSFLAGLSGTAPAVGALQGGTPQPVDGHRECDHGTFCAVAYRVLLQVIDMGDREFDALYPEEVAA